MKIYTNQVVIDGEGTIILPRLNRIFVQGLTINELMMLLNEAFQKYVKYPNTEVIVLKYRPINILVKGEVVTPGYQTLKGAFSLRDAVVDNVPTEITIPEIAATIFELLYIKEILMI